MVPEWIDPHFEYYHVVDEIYRVVYLTCDMPAFYVVAVASDVAEALVGKVAMRYLPNGAPCLLIEAC